MIITGLKKIDYLINYLDLLYPFPSCELKYKKDYEFLLAVILSSQTTDIKVNEVTNELFKYNLQEISVMSLEKLENILKPVGMNKKKALYIKGAANKLINEYNMTVPSKEEELLKFKGVGKKVSNVVRSELFDAEVIAVDTHVKRVSKRYGLVSLNDNEEIIEEKLEKIVPNNKKKDFHFQMVLFGRYHCKSKNPDCLNCGLNKRCSKKGL